MVETSRALSIDLNADLGEYAGAAGASRDDAMLDVVSSANIACGAHAGDRAVMQRTVEAARDRGVAIGAHPSYPDREGFGRREMEMPSNELLKEIVSQLELLNQCCVEAGARLRYVKPHGALYNQAARDARVARTVVEAVRRTDAKLMVLGPGRSELLLAAARAGLSVAREAFADRAYLPDGSLLPRDRPGAVLHEAPDVAIRALTMARDRYVLAVDGVRVNVDPDSLCVHGDNPKALVLATSARTALERGGFAIAPFAK